MVILSDRHFGPAFVAGKRPALTRRTLLALALAGIVGAPLRAGVQKGLFGSAPGVDRHLLARAMAALARHGDRIWSRDIVAIADFGLPSSIPRFHLVDILAGTTVSLRVAHGKGSDPDHTGLLAAFSNAPGSNATSEGAYLTDELYEGVHGPSRRLVGLDPSNDRAMERAIVIHGAWYADAALLESQGRLGRSDGCFAFAEADIGRVLAMLGRGRLLYAGRGGESSSRT